jgi:WD40 repeat protein
MPFGQFAFADFKIAPDGRTLATVNVDGSIRLWELPSGRFKHILSNSYPAVSGIAFLPDGTLAANGAIWDVSTGKATRQVPSIKKAHLLRVSPDGKTIAGICAEDRSTCIRLWESATGKEIRTLPGMAQPLGALGEGPGTKFHFSPDGKSLAVVDGKMIRLWNSATGDEAGTIPGTEVAFTPESNLLGVVGPESEVHLWDLRNNRSRHRLGKGSSLAVSADGKTVATVQEDKVCLWDAATGRESLQLPRKGVRTVSFSPNNKVVVTITDEQLDFWEVATGKPTGTSAAFSRVHAGAGFNLHQGIFGHLAKGAFTPDGRTFFMTIDGGGRSGSRVRPNSLRRWEVSSGRMVDPVEGHRSHVNAIAFAPDGRTFATASHDNTVRLWETATGKQLKSMQAGQTHFGGWNGQRFYLAFSPDGKVLAGGDPQNIYLWDSTTGSELPSGSLENGVRIRNRCGACQFAFSSDGRALAVMNGAIRDASSGKELFKHNREWNLFDRACLSSALSPDGKILVGAGKKAVLRWEVSTRSFLEPEVIPIAQDDHLSFSPDGKLLTFSQGVARLWDAHTGRSLAKFHLTEPAKVDCLPAFSPNGKMLALAAQGGAVVLFEVATGKVRCNVQRHDWEVTSLGFSPDGKLLASGSADTSIILWDLARLGTATDDLDGQ